MVDAGAGNGFSAMPRPAQDPIREVSLLGAPDSHGDLLDGFALQYPHSDSPLQSCLRPGIQFPKPLSQRMPVEGLVNHQGAQRRAGWKNHLILHRQGAVQDVHTGSDFVSRQLDQVVPKGAVHLLRESFVDLLEAVQHLVQAPSGDGPQVAPPLLDLHHSPHQLALDVVLGIHDKGIELHLFMGSQPLEEQLMVHRPLQHLLVDALGRDLVSRDYIRRHVSPAANPARCAPPDLHCLHTARLSFLLS